MFLLASVAAGLLLSVLLGGRPSRLATVRFRRPALVPLAFSIQIVLFTRFGAALPDGLVSPLHYGSYALLIWFALANLRLRPLALLTAGLLLNAVAIFANDGSMPVSAGAAEAAGLTVNADSNVSLDTQRLRWLGDVFALPPQLPLANAFSIGDLLIAAGAVSFIVFVSLGGERRHADVKRFHEVMSVPAYRRLLIGCFVSRLGDWLTVATVVAWVYADSGSTLQVAIVLLARMLPSVVGGFGASALVGRLSHLPLLPLAEASRGGLVCLATAGVALGDKTVVLACLFLSGTVGALSSAIVPALVPRLTPPALWSTANAGLSVAVDAAMIAGAAGGAVVVAALHPALALAADTISFFVAAALFLAMPRLKTETAPSRARPAGGIRLLLARPHLALLGLAFAAATLATGLVNPTLPRLLHDAGLGAKAYGLGFAALAAGLVLGQLLFGTLTVIERPARWMATGLGLMAGLFVMLGLTTHGPTALLVLACIGLIDGTTDVAFQTAVQRESDDVNAARVFGCLSGLFSTTLVIAVALAPLANRLAHPGIVVIGSAAFLLLAASLALLAARRKAGALRVHIATVPGR